MSEATPNLREARRMLGKGIVIAGVGETEQGKLEGRGSFQLLAEVTKITLDDAGIALGDVEVLDADAGHLHGAPSGTAEALAHAVDRGGRGDVLVRVALAEARDVDGLRAHRRGPVGGGDDERRGAVGHQRAVHGVERGGDPAVVHDVLDRDHVAQHRVPLERGVLRLGRHDGRQGLLGNVMLVHVALCQEPVAADGGQPVGRLVGAVAHLAGHRDHARGADARAGVVPAHAQHDLGEAGVDRKGSLHGHERGGGAADGHRGEVARLHPQVVGERRRVHQRRLDKGEGGDHSVHVSQRDPGVVERGFRDLGEELERPPSLELSLLGLPHSGDHDPLAQHPPRFAQVGRGLAHPSPPGRRQQADRGRQRPSAARRPEATQGRGPGRRARTGRYATSAASDASRLVRGAFAWKARLFGPAGGRSRHGPGDVGPW